MKRYLGLAYIICSIGGLIYSFFYLIKDWGISIQAYKNLVTAVNSNKLENIMGALGFDLIHRINFWGEAIIILLLIICLSWGINTYFNKNK